MTDKQNMVAAFVAALISQTGTIDASKQELDKAGKLADKILKGEDDDSDDNDTEADDDQDSTNDEDDSGDEDDSDDSDDEGNDEEPQARRGKKKSSKKVSKKKAGKKAFKSKPQAYDRENDTHKEIFSGVLKAVAPTWKKDAKLKAKAKSTSVKLEGSDFLDGDGEVLASFKQSVKKSLGVK